MGMYNCSRLSRHWAGATVPRYACPVRHEATYASTPSSLWSAGFLIYMLPVATRTASQHGDEVDVSIGQHRCSEMGVLGLRAVILYQNVAQGALHRCPNQSAALAGVSD